MRDNAIANERRRRIDLRDRFSVTARRRVTEKYYDCLQCAEQCRHVDNNPDSNGGSNNGSSSKNITGTVVVVNRSIRNNYHLPASNVVLYPNHMEISSHDDARKIRAVRSNFVKSLVRHQPAHMTPAKKRSSLARPVRVHDSFVQPKRLMATGDDHLQDTDQNQNPRDQTTSCKNPWWWQEPEKRDQHPNTSSYIYRDVEEERVAVDGTGWPIRLRLEQMLELTLPQTKRRRKKKKKTTATAAAAAARMMLMKQQQHSRHSFKDTERLLKVLSINNVDQDNRYNVKRCSVM